MSGVYGSQFVYVSCIIWNIANVDFRPVDGDDRMPARLPMKKKAAMAIVVVSRYRIGSLISTHNSHIISSCSKSEARISKMSNAFGFSFQTRTSRAVRIALHLFLVQLQVELIANETAYTRRSRDTEKTARICVVLATVYRSKEYEIYINTTFYHNFHYCHP